MKDKNIDRTGETRTMNNGLKATIIEYFSSNDMTIHFENGEVREHISYGSFSAGEVKAFSLPNQKLKLYHEGEKRIMNDGFEAELITYRDSRDCDVLLADGTIREHIRYSQFVDGGLRVDIRKLKVGETRRMNNGLMATIIAYHSCKNIDIRFEDGFVRTGIRYEAFMRGEVAHPGLKQTPKERAERMKQANQKSAQKKIAKVAKSRLGERQQMETGRWCSISAYRSWRDIDVLFDDGELVEGITYKKFTNKTIQTPKDKAVPPPLIGQTNKANNGLMMTIIAARGRMDIDVRFEDGYIKYNTRYGNFKDGTVPYPKERLRVGETRRMNNGLMATIEAYHATDDMEVRFEDGCLVKHKTYGAFQNGYIAHPIYKNKARMSVQEFAIHYYLQKLGFVKIESGEWQNKGFGKYELDFFHSDKKFAIEYDGGIHKNCVKNDIKKNLLCKEMGITLYRIRHFDCPALTDNNSYNIMLSKDDSIRGGLIDCKKELEAILTENNIVFDSQLIDFVRDADAILAQYAKQCIHYHANQRLGERHWANSAQQYMTIIAYRSRIDMDVMFDNGVIREHVSYPCFQNGSIALYARRTKKVA